MKFTVEILTGLCNVLKSFVTALSIGDANVLPRFDVHFDADYNEILDDSLICHGREEFGTSFVTARFLILKSEESEQPDLVNDTKAWGDHPNIREKSIAHMFSTHTIDWFFDRNLISDVVYNRIQSGIKKIKWKNEVLSEVERISREFEYPLLSIQIRTWAHKFDPPNCINIRDGVPRGYNFGTYMEAIEKFIQSDTPPKTIFLSADIDSVLPEYLDYLKKYNIKVVTYTQPEHVTQMQYSAASMLIASKCDMLVCNRISTFAECIWWFGGCKATTIPLF
jgi:hypothetical protein